MNTTILRLSALALLGRRRGLVLAVVPALVVGLAVLVRALTGGDVGYEAVLELGYLLALPVVALLAASAVLGPEIDDGSIVYLLAKPVSRHRVATSKYAVAWGATLALGALPLALAGLVLDASEPARALGWGLGGALAATAYTALFLALAALTRHAVVVGLLFVLLWEGVFGSLFAGVRWLAIGAWGREVTAAVSDLEQGPGTGLAYALSAAAVVTCVCVWYAGDRLRSFTMRGDE